MEHIKKSSLVGIVFLMVLSWAVPSALAGQKVRCMLDWMPNPDHVPLYVAQHEGYFQAEGLDVDLMVPADPDDAIKLVASRKVQFAISYQPSVIIARSEGLPITAIAALVQHPLSTILFLKSRGFKTPADLKGCRVGYSVAPLYEVFFKAVAKKAGLSPSDYELYRVGFNLVPPLLTGQVDAAIGPFRNYEAIQLQLEGKEPGIFPLEENGIPDFYELVLITHPGEIKDSPALVKGFFRGLEKGIERTLEKPDEALEIFLKLHPDLRDDLNRLAFEATIPFFKGSPYQEIERWKGVQAFMLEQGLIKKVSPVKDLAWEVK